jgi:hypothetical protein
MDKHHGAAFGSLSQSPRKIGDAERVEPIGCGSECERSVLVERSDGAFQVNHEMIIVFHRKSDIAKSQRGLKPRQPVSCDQQTFADCRDGQP